MNSINEILEEFGFLFMMRKDYERLSSSFNRDLLFNSNDQIIKSFIKPIKNTQPDKFIGYFIKENSDKVFHPMMELEFVNNGNSSYYYFDRKFIDRMTQSNKENFFKSLDSFIEGTVN